VYQSIRDKLHLEADLPYIEHWSAAPDFLELISDHCLEYRPNNIVECSSGLTTLILARCCQLNDKGRVLSLENGSEYAEKTREDLKAFGLEQYAEVIHAPLHEVIINSREYAWYHLEALHAVSIDMLVIDGPSGFTQKHARYPAIPMLYDRLSHESVIYLDDASREDEKEIVEMWRKEYPSLSHAHIETERGCSLLSVHKT
jgi:predicted O-methyltransferase YrrM